MGAFKYRVSLRVFGGELPARVIERRLGLTADVAQVAGERRTTPSGELLDGYYPENYCLFRFKQRHEEELAELLTRLTADLSEKQAIFDHINSSGGRAEFFIGWFTANNSGQVFSFELLSRLAQLKINLSLDIYSDSNSTHQPTEHGSSG